MRFIFVKIEHASSTLQCAYTPPKILMILSSLSLTLILLLQISANVDLLQSSLNLCCALSIILTSMCSYTTSAQLLSANEDPRQLGN